MERVGLNGKPITRPRSGGGFTRESFTWDRKTGKVFLRQVGTPLVGYVWESDGPGNGYAYRLPWQTHRHGQKNGESGFTRFRSATKAMLALGEKL